jgi:PAS domain S-box-containing protein
MTIEELKKLTDVCVVIADSDGAIEFVNECFLTTFGWSQAEILGRPLTMIIPNSLRDAHNMGFSRFLVTGIPTLLNKALRLKAVLKDGSEIEAEHYIIAENQDGRWLFGATIRPLAS